MTDSAPPVHGLQIPGVTPALRMQVHRAEDVHVSTTIARAGIWEPAETRFLLATLRPGDVFVDVGANIGYFSLLASRLVGAEGEVLAFEPEAENYTLLESNRELNDCRNLRTFQVALGLENSRGTLYLNEVNRGDHSLYPQDSGREGQEIAVVNGTALVNSYCERVNFIKIDTQGAECDVLLGLREVIAANAADLTMIIEFSPRHLLSAGTSGRRLLELLADHPWSMYLLDEEIDGLLPVTARQVRSLNDLTEQDPASDGYFNLVVSGRPLEANASLRFQLDWGMYETALDYFLLARRLQPWDGGEYLAGDPRNELYVSSGWAFPEPWGRWSLGTRSCLKFTPADALRAMTGPVLHIRGRYFGPVEQTGVYLNGVCLGHFSLQDAAIPLPVDMLCADHLALELTHQAPLRPADLGGSDDQRELKFGLQSIAIRDRIAQQT